MKNICYLFVIVFVSIFSSLPVSADENPPPKKPQGNKFATVASVHGDVTATTTGKDGVSRKLKEGDNVYVGEMLNTQNRSEALLKTEDAGRISIRPNTKFVVDSFVAEDTPADSFAVRLLVGSMRIISGWVENTNRAGYKVSSKTATIGVRGTDHEPYVISEELAASTSNKEGTYDKVNRGGTTLQAGEQSVDIDPGKVGFAPEISNKSQHHSRALMVLMMPVLLEKVPDFYVQGQYDNELDWYSLNSHDEMLKALEEKRKAAIRALPVGCVPDEISKKWLTQLDDAIARRDANGIMALFAPDAKVRATVQGNAGESSSVEMRRDELAKSTVMAMKNLKDYSQHRVWTKAQFKANSAEPVCNQISLKSEVVEQGRLSDKPFRFESLEEYELALKDGKWLSVKAETTQH
jgi:hypothetical protein